MGKLIDADALKDWLEIVPLTGDGGVDINDLESWIAQQSTVNTWIPCSERPPEYYEPVLTWDGDVYCVEKRIPYICDDEGEHIVSDWWVSDDYDEAESDYYPNLRDGAAIAWMPLPEPWKGEQQ